MSCDAINHLVGDVEYDTGWGYRSVCRQPIDDTQIYGSAAIISLLPFSTQLFPSDM